MSHPVLRKLEQFGPLPEEDRVLLQQIIMQERDVPAKTDLICEGDDPTVMHVVTSGFACRHKRLCNGSRQIVAFLVPGDFADPHAFNLKVMDHSISTLAHSKIASLSQASFLKMLERPALAKAIFTGVLADLATLREWIATIGQRSAEHRIAHLFCEVTARLRAVGAIQDNVVRLPLTQTDLSDAAGLSVVHTNRSLQSLREKGLIRFVGGELEILDPVKTEKMCGFTANYLHLGEPAPREARGRGRHEANGSIRVASG